MFQRQTYTPEAARAGVTQDQVDAANDKLDQAEQASYQRLRADAQRLRADALTHLDLLSGESGPVLALLSGALGTLDRAQRPADLGAAVVQLTAALRESTELIQLFRFSGQPLGGQRRELEAREAQRQVAEQARRPVVLSVEQRLARIEKALGIT